MSLFPLHFHYLYLFSFFFLFFRFSLYSVNELYLVNKMAFKLKRKIQFFMIQDLERLVTAYTINHKLIAINRWRVKDKRRWSNWKERFEGTC